MVKPGGSGVSRLPVIDVQIVNTATIMRRWIAGTTEPLSRTSLADRTAESKAAAASPVSSQPVPSQPARSRLAGLRHRRRRHWTSLTAAVKQSWRPTSWIERLGRQVLMRLGKIVGVMAVVGATVGLAVRFGTWTPPVRTTFVRQMLFTGVDSTPICLRLAAAVGVLAIVQTAMWVDSIGLNTEVITPLLWRAIVRELAPLMACLVVIGRSGVAISTEMATMRIGGELEVLDAMGMDPMICVVMPRVLAMIFSVFLLATLMAATMIMTGYFVGYFVDVVRVSPVQFVEQLAINFRSVDLMFFVPKTLLAGGLAGAVAVTEGLSVRDTITDVPRVSARAGISALTAVFVVSAVLSVLIYGRLLVFNLFS